MAFPVITDKYIIIQLINSSEFNIESLKTLWVDKEQGIQEIVGMHLKNNKLQQQCYLFDKNNFTIEEARKWVKDKYEKKEKSKADILIGKKSLVTANMILCTSRPASIANINDIKLTEANYKDDRIFANLNDHFYFYVEGVHEGVNGNGDYFYEEELIKNYKSAGYQLIDWEHIREEIIGMSLEADLITKSKIDEDDTICNDQLALAFNGIINRLSPYIQYEEMDPLTNMMHTRDEIIKQRYFENKLAISMECFYDKIRCVLCGYETYDPLDFEIHKMTQHYNVIERGEFVPRGLIGVDFVGWGIVAYPADPEAYLSSLRTSDEGLIEDIDDSVDASLIGSKRDKLGKYTENMVFAKLAALSDPHDTVTITDRNIVFASEKKEIINTKNNTKKDNNNDNKIKNSKKVSKGGNKIMFDLVNKITKSMSINQSIEIALRTLKDYQGDKDLEEDVINAFIEEFNTIMKTKLNEKDFRVSEIYTLTDKEKLNAIQVARKEEQDKAKADKEELQKSLDSKIEKEKELNETISTKEKENQELKNAEVKREHDKKVDSFIKEVKNAGVELTETFEKDLRILVEAKLDNEDDLKRLKGDLLASLKTAILIKASDSGGAAGGEPEENGLGSKLDKVREETNKE